jgi:pimeloyl-ACP methyl ester carboxylesterase
MNTVEVNGLCIAYQRAGSGPPLVLLHGFISDSRTWRHQVEDLSRDFDVVAWDTPGCGKSSDTGEDFSMEQYADCLAGFLDGLGVASAHLLGVSWGGTLGIVYNSRFPGRVSSLVLSGAYAGWTGSLGAEAAKQRLARCLRESEMPAEEWVPSWVPEAFSNTASNQLLDEYASIMVGFHPVGFRAMSRAVAPDFRDLLPLVDVPTLLIWGEGDTRSPMNVGQAMCDSIRGARLVVIPNAGHVSSMEQPERFNAEVRTFLNNLP